MIENQLKELFEGASWRILPKDALPQDKFKADMVLIGIHPFGHEPEDGQFARGYIYNDSRGIFEDGEIVRTSFIKQFIEIDGDQFVETRNTLYRILDEKSALAILLTKSREEFLNGNHKSLEEVKFRLDRRYS